MLIMNIGTQNEEEETTTNYICSDDKNVKLSKKDDKELLSAELF